MFYFEPTASYLLKRYLTIMNELGNSKYPQPTITSINFTNWSWMTVESRFLERWLICFQTTLVFHNLISIQAVAGRLIKTIGWNRDENGLSVNLIICSEADWLAIPVVHPPICRWARGARSQARRCHMVRLLVVMAHGPSRWFLSGLSERLPFLHVQPFPHSCFAFDF